MAVATSVKNESNEHHTTQNQNHSSSTAAAAQPPPQLSPDILSYLISIFEILPTFKWIEDPLVSHTTTNSSKTKLPTAEIFTFLFNTGLSEMAFIFPNYRAKILAAQYKLIGDLIKSLNASNAFKLNNIDIVKTIATNTLVVNLDPNRTCKVLIPILIGKPINVKNAKNIMT